MRIRPCEDWVPDDQSVEQTLASFVRDRPVQLRRLVAVPNQKFILSTEILLAVFTVLFESAQQLVFWSVHSFKDTSPMAPLILAVLHAVDYRPSSV